MANEIERIAARFEPRLRRALLRAFGSLRVPASQIQQALETRGLEGVMALFDGVEDKVALEIRDELQSAVRESGRATVGMIPTAAVVNADFAFDTLNPATVDFIRNYELNLIRQVSEGTREAIRNKLRRDIVAGVNPRRTAAEIRQTVGLTARQELAIQNYRRALEELDPQALERQLRDKRFDGSIRRAISSGRPLTGQQIERMVTRYREKFIRHRATAIARTESMRAVTVGQQAAVRQMLASGSIDEGRLRRFWVNTSDRRTRDAHRRVPDMNPEGVKIGEPYATPLGPLMFPRDPNGSGSNTINCRCTEKFALVDAPKPATSKRPAAASRRKPKPKPAAAAPSTPEQLRAEYGRLRADADSGKFRGRDLTLAQERASAARIAWARTLGPDELRKKRRPRCTATWYEPPRP